MWVAGGRYLSRAFLLRVIASDGTVPVPRRAVFIQRMAGERRKAHRFSMKLPLEVSVPGSATFVSEPTITENVSYQGIYFTLHQEVPRGSQVKLRLTLPKQTLLANEISVECSGWVVRVEKHPFTGDEAAAASAGEVGVAAVIDKYEFLPLPS